MLKLSSSIKKHKLSISNGAIWSFFVRSFMGIALKRPRPHFAKKWNSLLKQGTTSSFDTNPNYYIIWVHFNTNE